MQDQGKEFDRTKNDLINNHKVKSSQIIFNHQKEKESLNRQIEETKAAAKA